MAISYQKLFELLRRRGLKKIDLRTTYRLNPKTVDRLVKGQSVTMDTIAQLCEAFDCQPGDLVEYIPEGTKP